MNRLNYEALAGLLICLVSFFAVSYGLYRILEFVQRVTQ